MDGRLVKKYNCRSCISLHLKSLNQLPISLGVRAHIHRPIASGLWYEQWSKPAHWPSQASLKGFQRFMWKATGDALIHLQIRTSCKMKYDHVCKFPQSRLSLICHKTCHLSILVLQIDATPKGGKRGIYPLTGAPKWLCVVSCFGHEAVPRDLLWCTLIPAVALAGIFCNPGLVDEFSYFQS